jgi:hypothetical protein
MRVVSDGGESVSRRGCDVRSPLVGGGVERAAHRTVKLMEPRKGEKRAYRKSKANIETRAGLAKNGDGEVEQGGDSTSAEQGV